MILAPPLRPSAPTGALLGPECLTARVKRLLLCRHLLLIGFSKGCTRGNGPTGNGPRGSVAGGVLVKTFVPNRPCVIAAKSCRAEPAVADDPNT